MSLFGSLARGVSAVSRVPVLGSALKAVPVLGTALTAADIGMSVYNMGNSGTKNGVPSLQQLGALPPLPAGSNRMALSGGRGAGPANSQLATIQQAHATQIGAFGGRGRGRHGIPPSQAIDMLIAAGVTLGRNYWKVKVCAPPGYVMVTDPRDGNKLAVPKIMAQNAGLWHPHAKPPISVRQWHALKNAKTAIKHLRKVEKAAHIVTHATTRHKAPLAIGHTKKRK